VIESLTVIAHFEFNFFGGVSPIEVFVLSCARGRITFDCQLIGKFFVRHNSDRFAGDGHPGLNGARLATPRCL
jgi:hypothetical protein